MSRVVDEYNEALQAWHETEWETYETPTRIGVRHRMLGQRPPRPRPAFRTIEGYNAEDQHPRTLARMYEHAEANLMGVGIACFWTMNEQSRAFDEAHAELNRIKQYMEAR
jgi:hypothetical protein